MEKFEIQIKIEQEQRKKVRHLEFITALFNHQQEFYEFHRRKYRILKKRTHHVRNLLDLLERKGIFINFLFIKKLVFKYFIQNSHFY